MEVATDSEKTQIWKWNKTEFLIETFEPNVAAQISRWKFSKLGPSVGLNHYRRQFLIPSTKRRLATKLLDIPYVKNPNRIKAGKQAALDHPIRRGEI